MCVCVCLNIFFLTLQFKTVRGIPLLLSITSLLEVYRYYVNWGTRFSNNLSIILIENILVHTAFSHIFSFSIHCLPFSGRYYDFFLNRQKRF